jgi:hypothetical protein
VKKFISFNFAIQKLDALQKFYLDVHFISNFNSVEHELCYRTEIIRQESFVACTLLLLVCCKLLVRL